MGLLGGVYEKKEKRKRARGDGALIDGKSVDLVQQVLEAGRAGVAVAARPGRDAEALHDGERLVTLQGSNYASKGAGEPTHIVV
jgi:hypothetical protein